MWGPTVHMYPAGSVLSFGWVCLSPGVQLFRTCTGAKEQGLDGGAGRQAPSQPSLPLVIRVSFPTRMETPFLLLK